MFPSLFTLECTGSKSKSKSKKKTAKKKKRDKKEELKEAESSSLKKHLNNISVVSISDCGSQERESNINTKLSNLPKHNPDVKRKTEDVKVIKRSVEFIKKLEAKESKIKEVAAKSRVSSCEAEIKKKEQITETSKKHSTEVIKKNCIAKNWKVTLVCEKESKNKIIKQ